MRWVTNFHLVQEAWFNIDAFLTYLSRPSVKNLTLRPLSLVYSQTFSLRIFYSVTTQSIQVCHYQGRPLAILFIVCQSINLSIILTLFFLDTAKLLSLFDISSVNSGFWRVISNPDNSRTKKTIISLYFSVLNIDCWLKAFNSINNWKGYQLTTHSATVWTSRLAKSLQQVTIPRKPVKRFTENAHCLFVFLKFRDDYEPKTQVECRRLFTS